MLNFALRWWPSWVSDSTLKGTIKWSLMYSTIWVQLYLQFLRHWDGCVEENLDCHRNKGGYILESVAKYCFATGQQWPFIISYCSIGTACKCKEHGIVHTNGTLLHPILRTSFIFDLSHTINPYLTSFRGVIPHSGKTKSCHYTLGFHKVVLTVHTFAYHLPCFCSKAWAWFMYHTPSSFRMLPWRLANDNIGSHLGSVLIACAVSMATA